MSQQIKFEKAKEKLNNSLEELEDLIISKIPDKNLRIEVENLKKEVEYLKNENYQKDKIIKNLDDEVNSLQQNMVEIGNETEFLNEKNKDLAENYRKKDERQRALLQDIIDYINQIEGLVRNEN